MRTPTMCLVVALASGGCRSSAPPSPPGEDDRLVREADVAVKEAQLGWEQADAKAEQSRQAALAVGERIDEFVARAKAAEVERVRYAGTLAAAREAARECTVTRERLLELHRTLLEYVSDPRRDAAIEGLEACRKQAANPKKADVQRDNAAMRQEVASALEEAFDLTYPDQRGHLVATVKGDVLDVALPTFSAWDAPRSQREVEKWCDSFPNFTSIALHNTHGTFKCRAKEQPRDYAARMLRASGLAAPWVPAPSGQKTMPSTSSDGDLAELKRLGRELDAAIAQFEADSHALLNARARAEKAIEHYEELLRHHSR
ncbi:hypothetical protein OV203_07295 [Nannocystis sp. ILAH1]|uniref:hypothetical protein n=1 Tax=unclassified Nannocystis TaxID=2627009 RepID=UPI00226E2081|nr:MULTISPECIES: hypothetical protein [unclassified Nannocystis]MCY0986920.1 hypothetical protein [Nannocystis sp. ILAH1]MCY1071804.1 hypothetical protein [Nannocystis sp. RBIL2]